MELGLRDKACIVTGAGRGIGLAIAHGLCDEGARVLFVGRDAEALRQAVDGRPGAEMLVCDVTAPGAAEQIVEACEQRFGGIDVLVNNAGTSFVRGMDELTDADWNGMWELHVMAPMRLTRTAGPRMAGRGGGRIVNVSSSSGKRPSLRNPAYSVTKAALLSLSRTTAEWLAPQGVLVNAVAPGMAATELWTAPGGMADQTANAEGSSREHVFAARAAAIPLGRLGEAREIADVVIFLCSDRAGFVTGSAWSVDGGAVPVII
jgi:3-oxoacyl-[acyl-carrier protein] reductase